MQIGEHVWRSIEFRVIPCLNHPLILGLQWFRIANPTIDWSMLNITLDGHTAPVVTGTIDTHSKHSTTCTPQSKCRTYYKLHHCKEKHLQFVLMLHVRLRQATSAHPRLWPNIHNKPNLNCTMTNNGTLVRHHQYPRNGIRFSMNSQMFSQNLHNCTPDQSNIKLNY